MFGLIKRHKERMAEIDRKHQQVMRGFRALDTARELLLQSVRGELPPVEIVQIGDGFYVEQYPDGSRKTVVLDKSKVPLAHTDNFVARVDGFSWTPPMLDITPPQIPNLELPAPDIKAPEIPPPPPLPALPAKR